MGFLGAYVLGCKMPAWKDGVHVTQARFNPGLVYLRWVPLPQFSLHGMNYGVKCGYT